MKRISLSVIFGLPIFFGLGSLFSSGPAITEKETAELSAQRDGLIDAVSKELTNGLFEALEENSFEKVKVITQGLKKINQNILKEGLSSERYNLDPLTFALIQEVDVEIMKYLIQEGAPVNPKNRFNNCDLLEVLVSQTFSACGNELSVNTGFLPGSVANSASQFKYDQVRQEEYFYEVARLLVQDGAPFTPEVIEQAKEHCLHKTAKLLGVNLKNSDGQTSLSEAVCNHWPPSLIELLLAQGAVASINVAGFYGRTPLWQAVYNNRNSDTVKLLLAHGAAASVNVADFDGTTPLWCAVDICRLDLVELLLAHGAQASVNVPGEKGRTPLFQAVSECKMPMSMVTLLLNNGAQASLNVPDKDQRITPLWHFLSCGGMSVDLLKFLIDHGAKVSTGFPDKFASAPALLDALRENDAYKEVEPLLRKTLAREQSVKQ